MRAPIELLAHVRAPPPVRPFTWPVAERFAVDLSVVLESANEVSFSRVGQKKCPLELFEHEVH